MRVRHAHAMTEAPTPTLPRGAGGPPRRAAGRVLPPQEGEPGAVSFASAARSAAVVHDPDPLTRLLAVAAAESLGYEVAAGKEPGSVGVPPGVWTAPGRTCANTVFLSLDHPAGCARIGRQGAGDSAGRRSGATFEKSAIASRLLVVGYSAGPLAVPAAHRAHTCVDLALALRACEGVPAFVHLPADDPVRRAGITVREADVLVLLLAGGTTAAIASRLCVSPATARSHCRAVLRKLGAADRRALRERLLAGEEREEAGAAARVSSRFA